MEHSNIYYSDVEHHDDPDISGQVISDYEYIYPPRQSDQTVTRRGECSFEEITELRYSRRFWMTAFSVVVVVSILLISLTLYFALLGPTIQQKTSFKGMVE